MVHNFLLFLIALPGYWVATYLMDSWGRKKIQKFGFFCMMVTYAILAGCLHGGVTNGPLLLIIYGLTFFFSNFGPNSTTFILPSESFPAECRASLNGFSAAMGKTGAAIGSAATIQAGCETRAMETAGRICITGAWRSPRERAGTTASIFLGRCCAREEYRRSDRRELLPRRSHPRF